MAPDKRAHFAVGMVAATATIWVVGPWIALLVVAALGAGKEAFDATGRGPVEFADFVATVAGWVPVALVWWVTGHAN